jgi:hypothetical protein
MSYIIFYDNKELLLFEGKLTDDDVWKTEIDSHLISKIPDELHVYIQNGDYFLLFNVDLESYNDDFSDSISYRYIFLIYQKENNRLLIFEYVI